MPTLLNMRNITDLLHEGKTSLENDKSCYYLASEVKLVAEECLALRNDHPALQKYMADRRIAATALMQVRRFSSLPRI